jgi:hypothetical protein
VRSLSDDEADAKEMARHQALIEAEGLMSRAKKARRQIAALENKKARIEKAIDSFIDEAEELERDAQAAIERSKR